jgi:hypothetical protein
MPDGEGCRKAVCVRSARFDRGPLAKQQPWWVGYHAPAGKPTGLSPTTYRSLISQWPTLPA